MPENKEIAKPPVNADWFVRGALTKIGDIFDRYTGRGWKPSSSLATSELVERLKQLMDSDVREDADGRQFVPHIIGLKMQWDKFSTDSDESLKKLETELLTAAVDHINDRRYYTYAPLSLAVKQDYFTQGVKLCVSYEQLSDAEREAEVPVSYETSSDEPRAPEIAPSAVVFKIKITFPGNISFRDREFSLQTGERISIGRTKENRVAIDDASISKFHASLVCAPENRLILADIGSTNGTFLDGQRIAYGKSVELGHLANLKFGGIEAIVETHIYEPKQPELPAASDAAADSDVNLGSVQVEPIAVSPVTQPALELENDAD